MSNFGKWNLRLGKQVWFYRVKIMILQNTNGVVMNQKYPVWVLLKLLAMVAKKHGSNQFTERISKRIKEKYNLSVTTKYFSNDYAELKNKYEHALVRRSKPNLEALVKEAGYETLDQYLSGIGFQPGEMSESGQDEHNFKARLDQILKRNPPHANEWIDKYIVGARIMPAFLGVFPLFITLFFVAVENRDWSNSTLAFAFFIGLGLTLGLAGWLSIFGKRWESKLFFHDGKKGFPTTYMMLFSTPGRYSEARKVAYRQKISAYFGIPFPSKEEELANEREAIQKLNEAGVRVKNTVKSVVIRSALTRYGFQRNLVPASLLATVLAIPCMALGIWKNNVPLMGAMALCLAAGAYYSLRYPKWLKAASEAYARYLIDDFLSR